jgi:hypothetical protein
MKKGKIIPLYPKNIPSEQEWEKEFEEKYGDFEGWEEEYDLVEAEDWEGLIKYYQRRISAGQEELCINVADVYIDIKEYDKAIEFLQPFHKKEPDNDTIQGTINKALNYKSRKEVLLTRKDFDRMYGTDLLNLFYDENCEKINNKSFKANVNELFKKYEYLSVDIDNNIYGIKKEIKELIKNEPRAYSTANDLLV